MITTQVCTVINISQNVDKAKKDGGTFKATILYLKAPDGSVREKQILQAIVDKAPGMKQAIDSINPMDTVTIVLEKKDGSQFNNIVGVYKGDVPDAKPQQASWSPASKSSTTPTETKPVYQPFTPKPAFDSLGAQVGNALTNAALLIAHKAVKGTLETEAENILRLGEKLKAKLAGGSFKYTGELAKQATTTNTAEPFVEEDIDF